MCFFKPINQSLIVLIFLRWMYFYIVINWCDYHLAALIKYLFKYHTQKVTCITIYKPIYKFAFWNIGTNKELVCVYKIVMCICTRTCICVYVYYIFHIMCVYTHMFPWWSSWWSIYLQYRNPGSIPGLGRPPGGGNGNLLLYSCLENPWIEELGGLQSTGFTKSWTRLSD